jgi:hypothetical protein
VKILGSSEPRPSAHLPRSKDLAARRNDSIPEPAFKTFYCEHLRPRNSHSFQLGLKGAQEFSECTIER